ncbi:MAG: threonine synthase [Erysipelotrichaceae bacterium]|nr:threonine synthase [Erysipelotrichaceae bacterium]
MLYESTRSSSLQCDEFEALLKGSAEDGGLYVDRKLQEKKPDLHALIGMDYRQCAYEVLSRFFDGIPEEALKKAIGQAYDRFAVPETVRLVKAGPLHVLELFHGPTSAFKDVALTLLPHLLGCALKKDERALILTATSGDTGKAAMAGFADVPNTDILVYYPKDGTSRIQELQMTTQQGNNVSVFGLKGNFDDAQTAVKKVFADQAFRAELAKKKIRLTSANSINIGRLTPQIVYYFYAYRQLVREGCIKEGEKILFSVPSGNFGDVLAGYYAYCMGLPVKRFIVASNANNVLTDFIRTGVYDAGRPFYKTISPSMDILISSNLERLIYYISGGNNEETAGYMRELKEKGSYRISEGMLKKLQELFAAECFSDEETSAVIRRVYETTGYLLDPHSAVGYAAAEKHLEEGVIITLATASPFKFPASVLKALGKEVSEEEFSNLHLLEECCGKKVPEAIVRLQELPVRFDKAIAKEDVKRSIEEYLEEHAL